jgi:predicted MPP superfamily phosphohydrolase
MAPGVAAVAGLGLAWGLFEAQWVEMHELEVPVEGLPDALDGFRILHLSDFHLGNPSLNGRALEKAVRYGEEVEVDLVAVTGDLLSRQRGEPQLRTALRRLRARHGVVAVLGNHDVAITRDPFSAAAEIEDLQAAGATLLRNETLSFEHDDHRVQVVGADPRSPGVRPRFPDGAEAPLPAELGDRNAGLRILLSHFPDAAWMIPQGSFHVVLAGHLHGGQLCIPTPWGKVGLAHPRPRHLGGVKRVSETTLVVSRGIGTTFVPFRFLARPEAAVLVLRRSRPS